MAYSELIKNFNLVRDYMREFYVYGFKSRESFTQKSLRAYDDEKRRIESWLGEYMRFHSDKKGKKAFLSIDSRNVMHNPLFKAWKAASFTDKDITIHFILFDILSDDRSYTLNEIAEIINIDYLSHFDLPMTFDDSTIRKKLKEYAEIGIVCSEKIKNKTLYKRALITDICKFSDLLCFFSEAFPCGVIGSFLLDKLKTVKSPFSFKHHYITQTMDSDILALLFSAISEKREVTISNLNRNKHLSKVRIVPLKIYISAQNGRQYVMAYTLRYKNICAYRIDYITEVDVGNESEQFDKYIYEFMNVKDNIWGVMTDKNNNLDSVDFTVRINDDEQHIIRRLEREKRCGTVNIIDKNTLHFHADVYDCNEMIPWIRTFICRITDLTFSGKNVEHRFKEDIKSMYEMYGLGEVDAL